jgi:hypothetical protein
MKLSEDNQGKDRKYTVVISKVLKQFLQRRTENQVIPEDEIIKRLK